MSDTIFGGRDNSVVGDFDSFVGMVAKEFEDACDLTPLPKGVYYAKLEATEMTNSKSSGTPGQKFTFVILKGSYAKRKITGTSYWTEKTSHIKPVLAERLGILRVDSDGKYHAIYGKNEWASAIGTEVFIEIVHEERLDSEKRKTGIIDAKLAFIPVLKRTDKRVIELAAQLGIALGGEAATSSPGIEDQI